MNDFITSAHNAPKGLPVEQLTPGLFVTISPSKASGDRSYSHDVWEIVAFNKGHVICKPTGKFSHVWLDRNAILSIHEHDFYDADHLMKLDD